MRELAARVLALGRAGVRAPGASVQDAMGALLIEARRALGCQAGAVYRVEADHLACVVAHNDVIQPSALAARVAQRLPLDRGAVPGWVLLTGRALHSDDVTSLTDPPWDATFEQAHGFRTRSLLALPLVGRDKRVIGVLELQNGDGLRADGAAARVLAAGAGLALEQTIELERLAREQMDAVCSLATISEYRDSDIAWHVRRISGYSVATARALGMEAPAIRVLQLASTLHDVGKVGIPPSILFKPGKLTDDEFLVTREHCQIGHQVLRNTGSALLDVAAEIALTHHERWDGTGYPAGLVGQAAPLHGRIVAVADVFDALTTRRIYKPAMGIEQSLRIIQKESGRHFDPELVDAFQRVFPEVLEVKRRFTLEE